MADAALIVEVSDRGRRIPKEELPRLLEPGFRGSNAASVPGTGTELTLVARNAAAHRGKVAIGSTLGAGTSVHILLPQAAPALAALSAG